MKFPLGCVGVSKLMSKYTVDRRQPRASGVRLSAKSSLSVFVNTKILILSYKISIFAFTKKVLDQRNLGPPQVKCWFLISNIFHVMNFRHFLEMLEIKSRHLT